MLRERLLRGLPAGDVVLKMLCSLKNEKILLAIMKNHAKDGDVFVVGVQM